MAPSPSSNTKEIFFQELQLDFKRIAQVVHQVIIEKTICRSKNLPVPLISLNNIRPEGFFNDSIEYLTGSESEASNPEELLKGMSTMKNRLSVTVQKLQKCQKQRELCGHTVEENDQQFYDEEEGDSISVSELCKLTHDKVFSAHDSPRVSASVNKEKKWPNKILQHELKKLNVEQKSSKFEHCSGLQSKQLHSTKLSNVYTCKAISLTRVTRNRSQRTSGTECNGKPISEKNSVRKTFTNDNCSLGNADPIVCDKSTDDDSTRSYLEGATITHNRHCSRKPTSFLRPVNGSISHRGSIWDLAQNKRGPTARLRAAKTSASFESLGSSSSPVSKPVTTKNISPTDNVGAVSHLNHLPLSSSNKTLRNGKCYEAFELTKLDYVPKDEGAVKRALGHQLNSTAKGCYRSLLTNGRQHSKTANTGTPDCVQDDARHSKYRFMQQLKSSTVDPFARRPQCGNSDIQCSTAIPLSGLCQLSSNAIINDMSDHSQIQLTEFSIFKSGQTETVQDPCQPGNTVKNASSSNFTVSRGLQPQIKSKQSYLFLYHDGSHGIFSKLSSGQHWRPSDANVGSAHVCSMSFDRAIEPNFKTVDFLKCAMGIGSSEVDLTATEVKTPVLPAEQVVVPNLSTIVEETGNSDTSMAFKPVLVSVEEGEGTRLWNTSTSSDESVSSTSKSTQLQSSKSIEYQINSYNNEPSGGLLESVSKDNVNVLGYTNNNESAKLGRSSLNYKLTREAESQVVDLQKLQSITSGRKSSSCDKFASRKLALPILQECFDGVPVDADQQGSNNLYAMVLENDVETLSLKCTIKPNEHEKHRSKLFSGTKRRSFNSDSVTYASISSNDSTREELAKQSCSLEDVSGPSPCSLSPTKPSNTVVEDENCTPEEVLEDARSEKSNVSKPPINLDDFSQSEPASLEPIALTAPSSKNMADEPVFVQLSSQEKIPSLQMLQNDRDSISSPGACSIVKDPLNKTTDSFNNCSQIGLLSQTKSFNNFTSKSLNLLGSECSDSDSDNGDSICYPSAVSVHKKQNYSTILKSLCKHPSLPERELNSVKLVQSMLLDD